MRPGTRVRKRSDPCDGPYDAANLDVEGVVVRHCEAEGYADALVFVHWIDGPDLAVCGVAGGWYRVGDLEIVTETPIWD
jgi:hypothetical protein